jgi:16S rRNA (cytosine967-C5)-methyltransferase
MTGTLSEIVTNGRDVAVLALRDRQGNVSAELDQMLMRARIEPVEKSLARELTLGTLRRQGTLRAVRRAFLLQPDKKLPGVLEEIIDIALYQILFLSRVPEFAAVDEAVKAAEKFRHKRQAGLVNGLLRSVTRSLGPVVAEHAVPARDVIPIGPNSYRKSAKAIFPDPPSHPVDYLAAAYSLPEPLARQWMENFGTLAKSIEIATHANVRAPMILRVNRLKTTPAQLLATFRAAGIAASLHANGLSLVLDESSNVMEMPGFADGLFQPQDPTASAVGETCGQLLRKLGSPAASVLDFCASPGTKTTHIAECMNNQGSILALDVSPVKLEKIVTNCRRMGVTNVRTGHAEQAGGLAPQSYDLVLADVPCSNTGVLARRPEARWRFTHDAMSRMVKDQQFLIQAAAGFARPGGYVVYSTCSLEPDECSEVARFLLRQVGRMKLVEEKVTLPAGAEAPTSWHDGGYCAVFKAG